MSMPVALSNLFVARSCFGGRLWRLLAGRSFLRGRPSLAAAGCRALRACLLCCLRSLCLPIAVKEVVVIDQAQCFNRERKCDLRIVNLKQVIAVALLAA